MTPIDVHFVSFELHHFVYLNCFILQSNWLSVKTFFCPGFPVFYSINIKLSRMHKNLQTNSRKLPQNLLSKFNFLRPRKPKRHPIKNRRKQNLSCCWRFVFVAKFITLRFFPPKPNPTIKIQNVLYYKLHIILLMVSSYSQYKSTQQPVVERKKKHINSRFFGENRSVYLWFIENKISCERYGGTKQQNNDKRNKI